MHPFHETIPRVITPEFWTPQLLSENEIGEICNWLYNQQRAWVMAVSVMEEPIKEDCSFVVARNYIQDLIRHLSALAENKEDPSFIHSFNMNAIDLETRGL